MKINLLGKGLYNLCELSNRDNEIISDLELKELFKKAANDDPFLERIFPKILLHHLKTKEEIEYRQAVYNDLKKYKEIAIELYLHARKVMLDLKSKFPFGIASDSTHSSIATSISILGYLSDQIDFVRSLAYQFKDIKSEGLNTFRKSALEKFSKENVAILKDVVESLDQTKGLEASASLNESMAISSYKLCRSTYYDKDDKRRWKKAQRIFFQSMNNALIHEIEVKNDLILDSIVTNFSGAAQNIKEYFSDLATELGFYIAAMNLEKSLNIIGAETSMPILNDAWEYENLYDAAITLKKGSVAVGNDHKANMKIMVITGANQGGKTTYIRSLGQAYLLMQSGLFVNAKSLSLPIIKSLFTHFDKEEDKKLESGKFDDELRRFKIMLSEIEENSLILLNESFQSTSEHEGSKIGFEIISALVDSNVKVVLVTHMYDLSMLIKEKYNNDVYFLRAERIEDGKRSFKITEGEPLRTSYGLDLYKALFKE